MPKSFQFFATGSDILTALQFAETGGDFSYTLMGNFTQNSKISYARASDILNLGKADYPGTTGSTTYLITRKNNPCRIRAIDAVDVPKRYLIDQLINPDSVTLTPAGVWEDCLLGGILATAHDTPESRAIFSIFQSALRRHFKNKVKGASLGAEAMEWLRNGKRLTACINSPVEFNLKP